jgi:hypothetical protein
MAKGKYQKWLEPEGLTLIEGWARDGLTDEQIAERMGINVATLYRWKNDHCEICESLKKSKEVVDDMVENALLRNAMGEYKITEERRYNPETRQYEIVIVKRETRAPDTTAQIFWLKNRRPDKWRDKREVENTAPTNAFDSVKEITAKMLGMQEDRSLDDFLTEGGDDDE